jgi:hypothetical protein
MFRKEFESFCSAHSWYKISNDDYYVAIIPVINAHGRDFSMSETTKDDNIKILVHSHDVFLPHIKSLNKEIWKLISKNTMQINATNYSSQSKYEEFEVKTRDILKGIINIATMGNQSFCEIFVNVLNYDLLKKRRLESIIPLQNE